MFGTDKNSMRMALLPVLFTLGSCHSDAIAPSAEEPRGVSNGTAAPSASPAAASARADASAQRPPDAEWPPRDSADEPSGAELDRSAFLSARKEMAAKNYDKAIALYTKALSTGASDALALGERGYAKFLRAKTDAEQSSAMDEARRDLWLALGSRGEPKTYARVWYNLGLLHETRGELEEARASFARSEAVAPSSQAASKLAGKSKCLAAIDRKRSHYESTHVVDGWVGIAKVRNIKIAAKDPAQATQKARAAVCTDSRPHESDVSHGCTSQPPWHVSHDYGAQPFMDLEELLVPLKNDKFLVVEVGLVGGWPARCLFGAFPSHVVSGRVLVLRSADVQATVNDAVPAQNDQERECIDGPTEAIETAYDMHTGRFLLEVRSVVPNVPKLSFNSAGTEATLEGAGCHETVAVIAQE